MTLILFFEQLLNGIQFGIMLFLMSAGLTLIFGVMGLINLAHGSFYMIGAFCAALIAGLTGSFWLALLASLIGALAGGSISNFVPEIILKSIASVTFFILGIRLFINSLKSNDNNE